jgi:hypothetical protein
VATDPERCLGLLPLTSGNFSHLPSLVGGIFIKLETMTEKQTRPIYTARLTGVRKELVERGWEFIPEWARENPTHTDKLRARVDALADLLAKRGHREPWHKAFDFVCMMQSDPDWWIGHRPDYVAIVQPRTLPPVASETVFLKDGYLPLCWREIPQYERLWEDDDLGFSSPEQTRVTIAAA